ncbi:hypothetical protein D3C87_1649940 [compost metagenome]
MRNMKSLVTGMMILSFAFSAFAQEDQHRGPRGRGPQLTETQRSCLENLIGRPGEGERPSHEQMDAAFTACGIAKPNHKPASTSSETSSSEAAVQ